MSEAHYHTSDSGCLEGISAIPTGQHKDGQPVMVPSPHWHRCTHLVEVERTAPWRGEYAVHEHGGAFHAHEPRELCQWPA